MQAFFCRTCSVSYDAGFRGKSCLACGEELIHGRLPASQSTRRNQASAGVGRAVWDHILKRDPCCYCGVRLVPRETTIDHILPKALGGSKGSWTNRTASCRECNSEKAHTPLLYFMLEQRGMDFSHIKDEDDNWPIPNERAAEQFDPHPDEKLPVLDPRRILAMEARQMS